jgi:hypothetical protein
MKHKEKKKEKKTKKSSISTVLYIIALVVGITGVTLLINNIYLFNYTVGQYVSQGYSASAVRQSLLLTQLLPGLAEPIALYGGMAFMLFAVGKINKNISKYFLKQNESDNLIEIDDAQEVEDNNLENNDIDTEIESRNNIIDGMEESISTELNSETIQ